MKALQHQAALEQGSSAERSKWKANWSLKDVDRVSANVASQMFPDWVYQLDKEACHQATCDRFLSWALQCNYEVSPLDLHYRTRRQGEEVEISARWHGRPRVRFMGGCAGGSIADVSDSIIASGVIRQIDPARSDPSRMSFSASDTATSAPEAPGLELETYFILGWDSVRREWLFCPAPA